MPAGKLGCLPPHPEHTHPMVKLATHLSVPKLPPIPAVVDYASAVKSWPMYLNNQIGDCTCAGIAHAVQAWTAYTRGLVTLPNSAVLSLYEAMGYNPADPGTDQGAVESDVLKYVQASGISGHKILAYAQVDPHNLDELKAALYLFGSVYMGGSMPQSALDQTDAGQPWTVQTGSPIVGGHAYVLQRWDASSAPMEVVTWGQLQQVTPEWWLDYGSEAWAVISPDWLNAQGQSITGLDLVGLGDEFSLLSDVPNPFRKPATRPFYCFGVVDKLMTKLVDKGKHAG